MTGTSPAATLRVRQLSGRMPWRSVVPLVGTTGAVLLLGLVSAKVAALLLGPEGVGRLSIAQGVVMVVSVLATASTHEGLVRFIAQRSATVETDELARARQITTTLVVSIAVVVGVAGVAARGPLARLLFPGSDGVTLLLASLAGGLLFCAASVMLALTTAYRRVELFALGNGLSAVSTPLVSAVGFWWFGIDGIAPVVVVSNALSLLGAVWVLHRMGLRRTRQHGGGVSVTDGRIARELVTFGVPQVLFHLTSLSFLLVTPVMAQQALGTAETGLFRAAFTLSSGVGLLLTFVIGQELFPRMAALSRRRDEFVAVVNQGTRLVALGGGALAVVGMALSPIVLRVLFTSSFTAAAQLFRWLLLTELVRLVALVLTSAVSAARGTGVRLVAGLFASLVAAGSAYVLMHRYGLAGAGIGPLLGQVCGLALAAVLAWRLSPVRIDRRTVTTLGLEAGALTVLLAVAATQPIWLTVPLAAAAMALLGWLGLGDVRGALEARGSARSGEPVVPAGAAAPIRRERPLLVNPLAQPIEHPPAPAVVIDLGGGPRSQQQPQPQHEQPQHEQPQPVQNGSRALQ